MAGLLIFDPIQPWDFNQEMICGQTRACASLAMNAEMLHTNSDLAGVGRLDKVFDARAHVVHRLERRYDKSAVRAAYERFCCKTEADA
jgi:hypothetical protein